MSSLSMTAVYEQVQEVARQKSITFQFEEDDTKKSDDKPKSIDICGCNSQSLIHYWKEVVAPLQKLGDDTIERTYLPVQELDDVLRTLGVFDRRVNAVGFLINQSYT